MRTTDTMKALAIPGVLAGGLACSLAALSPTSAAAIPVSQKACANSALTLTGGSATYHAMGVAVHVNDGNTTRRVIAFTSMDANLTPNAEMRLNWSIDGRPAIDCTFSPGNIAENQQFWGTRTVMDVIRLGPRNSRAHA